MIRTKANRCTYLVWSTGSDLDQGGPGERILSDLVFARGRLGGSEARRAPAQGGGGAGGGTPPAPAIFSDLGGRGGRDST
jgi:hypothetical protein